MTYQPNDNDFCLSCGHTFLWHDDEDENHPCLADVGPDENGDYTCYCQQFKPKQNGGDEKCSDAHVKTGLAQVSTLATSMSGSKATEETKVAKDFLTDDNVPVSQLTREQLIPRLAGARAAGGLLRINIDELNKQITTLTVTITAQESEHKRLCVEFEKLLATIAMMRGALQRIWDEIEMGWIMDGESSIDCGYCKGTASGIDPSKIKHDDSCVQGYIYDAINLPPPSAIAYQQKFERMEKALLEIANAALTQTDVLIKEIAKEALTPK